MFRFAKKENKRERERGGKRERERDRERGEEKDREKEKDREMEREREGKGDEKESIVLQHEKRTSREKRGQQSFHSNILIRENFCFIDSNGRQWWPWCIVPRRSLA